ncbi:hypothetical protein N9B57_05025 [Verrucomicrobia bacterium]|nr:hypothetical protein [Verrucomicrobiota bacterium]
MSPGVHGHIQNANPNFALGAENVADSWFNLDLDEFLSFRQVIDIRNELNNLAFNDVCGDRD